ncbi:uncharacterized protein MELLADRAFT_108721 [Melampsora larici-populina 98AG31]|uniref:F-box domain-containing protein n=1 Tax=Melampsora larici-populina (strain 98AG31 / pathotype 3-4-7) TaxID=747676 RepID=F4RU13_MELLP|nr:uncharacterized protein MELLADRAFT_108721 [Melampsora larici-populina 98AG31]EGG04164.1 hypothetical protein MELLADRAFT_108721 [Melampsora larici-populina 98AG31]
MTLSCRATQLQLWREIASEGHELNEPVKRHLDFIQRRFDRLDSEGFVWSKDSILGIFLQLGLPEGQRSPFFLITFNELLESRVVLRSEISSHVVKEVVQIQELEHKTRRLGLLDLPLEIFHKILERLEIMAMIEASEIKHRKHQSTVVISNSGNKQPYMTYLHRNSPILNTIQTFAITCREVYQICRPWLWRRLKFPTRLPAPIDLWTKDILLKQGSLVQSLELELSKNCGKPVGFAERDSFYDNLTIQSQFGVQCISPENVKKLIHLCFNLSTLNFWYELDGEPGAGVEVFNFLLDLSPLITGLKQLRHLSLSYRASEENVLAFPSKLILGLPLLESLRCFDLDVSADQGSLGDGPPGLILSKLQHLSTLFLFSIEGINENWCLYDWPKKITHLRICRCNALSSTTVHQIIQHIAPHLKTLLLCFKEDDNSLETDSAWNAEIRFSLPHLIDLTLCAQNPHLLDSFRNCKSLRTLYWNYMTVEHCRTLNGILFRANWPELKNLTVLPNHYSQEDAQSPQYQAIEGELVWLENYCEEADIKAVIHRRRRFAYPYQP